MDEYAHHPWCKPAGDFWQPHCRCTADALAIWFPVTNTGSAMSSTKGGSGTAWPDAIREEQTSSLLIGIGIIKFISMIYFGYEQRLVLNEW
jgi:hypothetical protein